MTSCTISMCRIPTYSVRARLATGTQAKQTSLALTPQLCGLHPRRRFSCNVVIRQPVLRCTCQAHKGIATDSSVLGTRNKHKLLARQRHALFNDFTLTIPFGIVNIVAGFLSLFFKGGWTGTFVSLAGGILFTLGSMSHHNTYEATDATWGHTLFSAAIAAALAQKYYQKAIVGVAGTMVMTIASAVISLGLIYNVVAGGNKAQSGAAAGGLAPANNLQEPSSSTQGLTDAHNMSTGLGFKLAQDPYADNDSMHQQDTAHTAMQGPRWGANTYTVAAVTGIVLYAQGLWGLWDETVGHSPAGLAAATALGLAILGIARAVLVQAPSDQTKLQ